MLIKIVICIQSISLLVFLLYFVYKYLKLKPKGNKKEYFTFGIIGFIGYVFDSMGIGSYAVCSALIKFTKSLPTRLIPGTLNVSYVIPLFFEVLIYVQRIEVETKTLLVLTLAQAFGGMIGATLANKAKQTDMAKILGFSLVIIAIFLVLKQYGFLTFLSSHNNAIGLSGIKLIIATIVLIIVGIFAAFGVGQYAPTIVTLYILGLSPLTAFPIMTVSSGIACLVISIKSIKHKTCSFVACATSAIPSVIGVFIGSTLLLYINPIILIYITCPIIAYTGISFLIDGFKRK